MLHFLSCQICVSLIGSTYAELWEQMEQLSSEVDLVEIRLDKLHFIDLNELELLRQSTPIPFILTLRKLSQGGAFQGSLKEQFLILKKIAKKQPDLMDLEADFPEEWVRELQSISPETKWIISWHDTKETAADLNIYLEKLYSLPGNYYKLACHVSSIIDSLRLLELAQQENNEKRKLCVIGMGEKGVCTRILAPVSGQPFTFSCLREGLETAPGQISFQALLKTYRFKTLNSQTEIFGLIGHPVDKSFSHLTHNAVFNTLKANRVYLKFDVEEWELELFFQLIRLFAIRGLSVTMPYKERIKDVLPLKTVGIASITCNTLLFNQDSIEGINTDGIGALTVIGEEQLSQKKIVLLGCGGTAKSIAYEAKKRGASITLLNRSPLHAQKIAEVIGVSWGTLEQISDLECDILIQTTPVGMSPHIHESVIPFDWIPHEIKVLDVISNPYKTKFLQEAKQKKCITYPGIELFIQQAILQFHYWLNGQCDLKLIEKIIRENLPMLNQKNICVQKSHLTGEIQLPPSKSHSVRAVLLGAMTQGISRIKNLLNSPDIEQAKAAAIAFGAKIEEKDNECLITGVGGAPKAPLQPIDVGNSGQVLRFAAALAALNEAYTIFTGDASICSNRPAQPLLEALSQLGGFAKSTRNNGYAPLIIKGPISSGKIELDGEDSQPVSALLMMASFVEGITEIYVKNPGEKPWIDLTLSWLDRLGVSYNYRNHEFYRIEGKQQRSSFELSIPGDLSSAAFPIAAAILTQSEITLHHVNMDDVQGDKQLIYLLQQMGANLYIDKNNQMLKVKPGSSLVGMMIDVNPFIDALPILAVLACFAKGETRLVNGAIARKKESNRLASITNELKKMGANIEETEDGLRISQSCLHGAQVNSYADHRIAMALIVAGLASDGVTEVIGIECIKKSFPNFIEDFQKMGAKIEGNYGF